MPNFNPFSSGKNVATLFEIRLENDLIVLRGPENEASSQILRGVVVLCLPSALKVEDIHLRMTGQSRVGWSDPAIHRPTIGSDARLEKTEEIFNHKWPPFVGGEIMGSSSSSKSITLAAANYEWPFEIVIPGSTPESVEGLDEVHVIYKLKATIARGRLSSDLHTYKPVRIVRTLDPAALELAHAMTIENVWPNKVEYSLQIPQKAVIFGTSIQIDMTFTPLLKGLKIGKMTCTLVETHDWTIFIHSHEKHWKKSRDIANWTFEMNEAEHYQDIMNESGQDGWVLKETLPVPKSLKLCMQDVEMPGIRIRHKVKFIVALLNPDGHVSELRASLPVTIFISPNMPIDESGNLLDQTPNSSLSVGVDAHAPPLYGEHILDQLYANIDPSGFRTPAPQSGIATPVYNRSRSGSAENVAPVNGVADTEVQPDALSNILQNLNVGLNSSSRNGSKFFRRGPGTGSGGNTPHRPGCSSTSSMQNSIPRSLGHSLDESSLHRFNPLSRRTSEEEAAIAAEGAHCGITSDRHTSEHIDYSEIDLSRVPSYTTALRAPARSVSYTEAEALPDYETAISAPPSPQGRSSNLATVAETPAAAELRAYGHGNESLNVNRSNNVSRTASRPSPPSSWNPLAGMVGLTVHSHSHSRGHSYSGHNGYMNSRTGNGTAMDADATRRLHLLQARGRVY